MKNIFEKFKKFFFENWYFIILIIPIIIFIYSMWDNRYYIGGDVMIPLHPLNNLYKVFMWTGGMESLHFLHLFWYLYFAAFEVLGISSLIAQKVFIILLLAVGFVFTYLLHKELFLDTPYADKKTSYLSALVFTFNPIFFLLVTSYLPLYGFPVCLYFFLKYLRDKRKIIWGLLFSIAVNFFFFIDLPQPKMLMVFAIPLLFLIFIEVYIRKYSKNLLLKNIFWLIVVFVGVNFWAILPLVSSTLFGSVKGFSGKVASHSGNADLNTASLSYIMRFYNLTIVNYYQYLGEFLTSWYFALWSFGLWGVLVTGFFIHKKKDLVGKIYIVLALAVLVLLFISKGPNPPFGDIYRFGVVKIPLARVFRTTSSVSASFLGFYASLIAVTLSYFSRKSEWGKRIFQLFVVLHIALFFPLYSGAKFYNSIFSDYKNKGFNIPKEYFELSKVLDNIKDTSKVFLLPQPNGYIEKKWKYSGADLLLWLTRKEFVFKEGDYGVSLTDTSIYENNPDFYKSFLLNNVGYVLLQKDSIGVDTLENIDKGTLILGNKYFSLNKIDDSYYLPTIYVPKSTIFAEAESQDVYHILKFPEYNIRSSIFLNDEKDSEVKDTYLPISNKVYSFGKLQEVAFYLTDLKWKKGWAWPEANVSPASLKYKLVNIKEALLVAFKFNDLEKVDIYTWLSAKRVVELQNYEISEAKQEDLLKSYVNNLNSITKILMSVPEDKRDKEYWGMVKKTVMYFGKTQGELRSVRVKEGALEEVNNAYNSYLSEIKTLSNLDCTLYCYKIKVPQNGTYKLYIDRESLADFGKMELSYSLINDQSESLISQTFKNIDVSQSQTWIDLGDLALNSDVGYKLTLVLPKPKNLIDTNSWSDFNKVEKNENSLIFRSQSLLSDVIESLDKSGESANLNLQNFKSASIQEWQAGKSYNIKFDYSISNGVIGVLIVEEKPDYSYRANNDDFNDSNLPTRFSTLQKFEFTDKKKNNSSNDKLLDVDDDCDIKNDNKCLRFFSQTINSSSDVKKAYIIVYSYSNKNNISVSSLENIEINKVIQPVTVLRLDKGNEVNSVSNAPEISYQMVNPTKYIVHVSKISQPFTMVLGESFDPRWKVYLRGASLLPLDDKNKKEFFQGEIVELSRDPKFIEERPLETWFEKEISSKGHFPVNGYANSWLIDPKEFDGKENIDLVIEYQPQKYLYLGFLVTGLFITFLLLYSFINKLLKGFK